MAFPPMPDPPIDTGDPWTRPVYGATVPGHQTLGWTGPTGSPEAHAAAKAVTIEVSDRHNLMVASTEAIQALSGLAHIAAFLLTVVTMVLIAWAFGLVPMTSMHT